MVWTTGLDYKFNNSVKKVKPESDTEQGFEKEQDNKEVRGWQWMRLWLMVSTICIISITAIAWTFYVYFPRSCDINRPSYLSDQIFSVDKCQPMKLSTDGNFSTEEEQTLPGAAENTSISVLPRKLYFVERNEWHAQPPAYPLTKLKLPVSYVFIGQTNTEPCSMQMDCTSRVRFIQVFHMISRGWSDIAYNFLVGGDYGIIYVGRSWDYMSSRIYGYNDRSLCISIIGGIFNSTVPTEVQLNTVQKLIELGVRNGKIAPDYKLLGLRQVLNTRNPEDDFYAIIKKWPHWSPTP